MTEQRTIHVDHGKFTIDVHALKKDNDEPSAMASYLSKTAMITNQDDSLFLTVVLKKSNMITGFQIENQDGEKLEAIDQHVNDETDERYELFQLDHFVSPLPVRVQYEAEFEGQKIKGDEELRLEFNEKYMERQNG